MILLYSLKTMVSEFDFENFSCDETGNDPSDEVNELAFLNFKQDEKPKNKQEELSKDKEKASYNDDLNEEYKKKEAELMERAEIIISSAKDKANEILKEAEKEALEITQKAYSKGLKEGYEEGANKAYEENKTRLEEETVKFFLNLKDLIEEYKEEKERLISNNIDELKDISIAVAEKVIRVSLKTSGEIIKKMIISATEKMRCKEWARIYISRSDASLLVEGSTDLIRAISHLSEHIKIIAMEDAALGTCIIELPDQIIDASASTQIGNIKCLLKGGGFNGGNASV